MSAVAAGTIVARSSVAFAAALAESLRTYHPDIPFYVLVADELQPASPNEAAPFRRVTMNELETPNQSHLLFRYDRKQVLAAKKPSLLRHLFKQGYDSVVFLDVDMLVLGDLSDLFARVSAHALSLTPHFGFPKFDPDRFEREHQLLLSGIYNAGFIGATDHPEAHHFLTWWEDRLHTWCEDDARRGLHYDQRWLDMAPAYVRDLYTHREGDCNVAYWNLPDFDVSCGETETDLRVNGRPCKLFHFSGFDPNDPTTLTRYPSDLGTDQREHVTPLLRHYAKSLRRLGLERTVHTPWLWERFSNGVPISACVRRLFASLGGTAGSFPDPFDASDPKSFYRWLREPAEADRRGRGPHVSRLWQALYEQHRDIQARFSDLAGPDRDAFVEWTQASGLERFGLPAEFALTGSTS